MRVEVAVLADYANVTHDGKLNVMGMFDHLKAPAFPCSHPSMVLVLRVRFGFDDREKTYPVKIRLVDADGVVSAGVDYPLQVGPIPPGQGEVLNQILPFVNLTFARPGEYAFELAWDGQERARVPLMVSLLQAPKK